MENTNLAEMSKLVRVIRYSLENSPSLPYHNFEHQSEVARMVRLFGEMERVSPEERHLLQAAAYMHDIVFVVGGKTNEEQSAETAESVLHACGYDPVQIKIVRDLIQATKLPSNPKNLLEQIICDADLDNLGTEKFMDKNQKLREELGLTEAQQTYAWYSGTLEFLNNHRYYTNSAKELRNLGLAKNMAKIGEIIMRCPR